MPDCFIIEIKTLVAFVKLSSKMLLEKKHTICIEVDRFKTEIVRASRAFISGTVPKLLCESVNLLGLGGVIGPPGPQSNWSLRHLRSTICS